MRDMADVMAATCSSRDAAEGIDAFLAKRPPRLVAVMLRATIVRRDANGRRDLRCQLRRAAPDNRAAHGRPGPLAGAAVNDRGMADDTILETRGLTKEFKGFVAVNDVDLKVRRGTIHALIGPNGAGKTTCFNLLTHFLTPTRGADPLQRARHHRLAAGRDRAHGPRALVPDLGGVPAPDRARERAHRAAAQARRTRSISGARERVLDALDDRARELIDAVGPRRVRATRRRSSSPYGRKRALEIATTLALDPEMMLLDEPTAGMTHEDVERIAALIKQRRRRTARC